MGNNVAPSSVPLPLPPLKDGVKHLLLAAAFLAPGYASSASYTVIDLATLAQGALTVVRGPNSSGNVVGGGKVASTSSVTTKVTGARNGLVLGNGLLQQINGPASGDYTTVFGINDVGSVVGGANTASALRAFVRRQDGATTELSPLAGDSSSNAFGVNNFGQAAGFSSGTGGERAVVWAANGKVSALPGAPALTSRGLDINEHGDVAGVTNQGAGNHASLWRSGGAQVFLPQLAGYPTSSAASINARGDVVGYSTSEAGVRRATAWPAGAAAINLGTLPGGDFSQAFGNNTAGTIVGTSTSSAGNRAVVWAAGAGPTDINTLIEPAAFVLTKAMGINNVGMIVALGHDVQDHSVTGAHAGKHEDHERPTRVFLLINRGAQ